MKDLFVLIIHMVI